MAKPDHAATIASALAPERLVALQQKYFEFAEENGLKNASSIMQFFRNDVSEAIYDLCYEHALLSISKIPLSEMPQLLQYLAPPESPDFPFQALGLHILLDQAPRFLFTGVNQRWTFGFFLNLAVRFSRELSALPEELRLDRVSPWQKLGYAFEAAWLRAFVFTTAYIHSEDLDNQLYGQQLVEEQLRQVAEKYYATTDPTRSHHDEDMQDLALFPRLVMNAMEGVDSMSKADAFWRFGRIVRAHESIIRRYGRYPYRNRSVGRDDKEDEAEFFRITDGFEVEDEEIGRALREDVKAGKVRPLEVKRPGRQ